MKFKSIFMFFNIVLVFSFGFIFLMPLFAVNPAFAMDFWRQSWYMGLGFLLVLGSLDFFFLAQWKLFSLLEKEDWEGLREYLSERIYQKKSLSSRNIRFYANACLLTSKVSEISRLREFLTQESPAQARRWALVLGLPLILEGKSDSMVQYFGGFKDAKGVKDRPWVHWAYAFGLLMGQGFGKLKDELLPLASEKYYPSLQLLSLFLLNNIRAGDPAIGPELDRRVPAFRKLMTRAEWEKHLEGARDRYLLLVFLNRMTDEALQWLFTPEQNPA